MAGSDILFWYVDSAGADKDICSFYFEAMIYFSAKNTNGKNRSLILTTERTEIFSEVTEKSSIVHICLLFSVYFPSVTFVVKTYHPISNTFVKKVYR